MNQLIDDRFRRFRGIVSLVFSCFVGVFIALPVAMQTNAIALIVGLALGYLVGKRHMNNHIFFYIITTCFLVLASLMIRETM